MNVKSDLVKERLLSQCPSLSRPWRQGSNEESQTKNDKTILAEFQGYFSTLSQLKEKDIKKKVRMYRIKNKRRIKRIETLERIGVACFEKQVKL